MSYIKRMIIIQSHTDAGTLTTEIGQFQGHQQYLYTEYIRQDFIETYL